MIFPNTTAFAVWEENWCDRCFQSDQAEQRATGRGRGCPIRNAALVNKTPPKQLTPGRAGSLMAGAFRCSEFMDKPASIRPKVVAFDEGPGLFDAPSIPVRVDDDHA